MFAPSYLMVVLPHQLYLLLTLHAFLEFQHACAHCVQRLCASTHELRKGGAIHLHPLEALGHAGSCDGVAKVRKAIVEFGVLGVRKLHESGALEVLEPLIRSILAPSQCTVLKCIERRRRKVSTEEEKREKQRERGIGKESEQTSSWASLMRMTSSGRLQFFIPFKASFSYYLK